MTHFQYCLLLGERKVYTHASIILYDETLRKAKEGTKHWSYDTSIGASTLQFYTKEEESKKEEGKKEEQPRGRISRR